MPPLSNLSINSAHQPALPPQQPQPDVNAIQSWADAPAAPMPSDHVQQPRPMQPQTWNPNMGIRFSGTGPLPAAGDQSQQQQGQQGQQGQPTWNPSSGIRFG